MPAVRALVFPIFCGLFGAFGLWVGITSLMERSPHAPLSVAYEARIRAREKDAAYSSLHRKWWWVVDVRFADGRSRSFRQEAPRGLETRFNAGDSVRVCSFQWRLKDGPAFEGLEIDDWLVRNWTSITGFAIGVFGIALSVLLPLHRYQRRKSISAGETPPP